MKHACRKISELASDSLDRPLSVWERVRFRFHLSICSSCKNCNENMILIRHSTALIQQTDYGNLRLSDEQRRQLHASLDKSLCD